MQSCKDESILRNSGLTTVFGGPLVTVEGKTSESVSILCNVTLIKFSQILLIYVYECAPILNIIDIAYIQLHFNVPFTSFVLLLYVYIPCLYLVKCRTLNSSRS